MPWPRGTSMSPNETLHMSNKYVTVWFFFVVLSSIVLTIVRSIQQTPRVSWAYQPSKHARMASKRVFNETHTRKKSQRRAIKIEIMYCQQSLTLWIFARIGANRNGAKIQRFFFIRVLRWKMSSNSRKKKSETDTNECINKVFCVLKGYMKWGAHLVEMQTADVLALIFATPGGVSELESFTIYTQWKSMTNGEEEIKVMCLIRN